MKLPSPDSDARRLWTRPGVLAALVAVLIVYGSLIPFDFAWSAAVARAGSGWAALLDTLSSPMWVWAGPGRSALGLSHTASDLLMNVLLYLPLGVTLRMALRARMQWWLFEVMGTCVLAIALSWSVESVQGLIPARTASLNDILTNTLAATAAALIAPHLWGLYKRLAFTCYCRLAHMGIRLRRLREHTGVTVALAVLNALVIGLWYVLELRRSTAGEFALPFERAYQLPYDVGALVLAKSLLGYAGIGCLLLLLTYTGTRRLTMGWTVLAVVLLASAAELSRAATHNAAPDITGPILALAAGTMMTVTVYTLSLAVRRAERRRGSAPYDGPDRRRKPHEYA